MVSISFSEGNALRLEIFATARQTPWLLSEHRSQPVVRGPGPLHPVIKT